MKDKMKNIITDKTFNSIYLEKEKIQRETENRNVKRLKKQM